MYDALRFVTFLCFAISVIGFGIAACLMVGP